MKAMKTLILLFVLISGLSFGQTTEFKPTLSKYDSTSWMIGTQYNFVFDPSYSTKSQLDSLVHLRNIKITGDSIIAISYLLNEYENESKLRIAAEDILLYITVNGYVTNWKAWHKAVKNYRKLKKYKKN